ncbi:MAG TPA: SdrD B-like domain-containing protein [Draconibacterium sp.]|nr:SdrD B-like domain-containing protein [Draconibacterium sp.]
MKKIIYIAFVLLTMVACTNDDNGVIIGTASADDGKIKAGITVQLYTMDTNLYTTTTTDNEGNFTISDIKSGNYYIAATVVSGGVTYDTGNTPQVLYVSGEIVKEVSLKLSKK